MSFAHGPKNLDQLKDLIADAWVEAKVKKECELCGNDSWAIIRDHSHDGVCLPLRGGTSAPTLGPSYMVYVVECRNCGNVRMFGKAKIEKLSEQYQKSMARLEADDDG